MALKAYGQGEHARVRSGIQMVMDRQLSSGGWNYGNTKVFRSELRPIPECTGFALSAVHGAVEEQPVRKSIEYLHERIRTIRTPLTLSWALSGLGAWSRYPQQSKEWVVESLERQKIYGYYPVSLLCQLVLSYHAEKGLLSLFEKKGNNG